MESLLGRKEQKLTEFRETAAVLQQEQEQCVETIAALDDQVKEIEQQLEQLGDAKQTYEALCDNKEKLIMEGGSCAADSQFLSLQLDSKRVAHSQNALLSSL